MTADEIGSMVVAAYRNNGQAQYDLGLAFFNGDGVPRNFSEAYFWLQLCISTPNIFWSPSPTELAPEAAARIRDKATLRNARERVKIWLAEYGNPVASDYEGAPYD